jgi:hypothetical protein
LFGLAAGAGAAAASGFAACGSGLAGTPVCGVDFPDTPVCAVDGVVALSWSERAVAAGMQASEVIAKDAAMVANNRRRRAYAGFRRCGRVAITRSPIRRLRWRARVHM